MLWFLYTTSFVYCGWQVGVANASNDALLLWLNVNGTQQEAVGAKMTQSHNLLNEHWAGVVGTLAWSKYKQTVPCYSGATSKSTQRALG